MTLIGFFKYKTGFIKDLYLSVILIIIFFLLYKKLRLTTITYSLFCFSLLVHNVAAFGFYNNSPFPIPYDYVTHFLGVFAATLIIANILSNKLPKNKKFNFSSFLILLLILLGGLGVGSIVENIEFGGYLYWGHGEGFFEFGTGDYEELINPDKMKNIVGGGYFDAMEDLIVNLIGAFLATTLFGITFFIFKKERI